MSAAGGAGASAAGAGALTDYHYRHTDWLITNVIRPLNFNLFFAFVHGSILEERSIPTFVVPKDTLVIQTGGGGSVGCLVYARFINTVLAIFKPSHLATTFSTFTGHHGNRVDDVLGKFLFNTPGETALNKRITLGPKDVDNPASTRFGVFRAQFAGDTLNLLPEYGLTQFVRDNSRFVLKQSTLVTQINGIYPPTPGKPNIVLFFDCVGASLSRDPSEYVSAVNTAGRTTHYGIGKSTGVYPRPGAVPYIAGSFSDPFAGYTTEELHGAINRLAGLNMSEHTEPNLPAEWGHDTNQSGRPYYWHRPSGFITWDFPNPEPRIEPGVLYNRDAPFHERYVPGPPKPRWPAPARMPDPRLMDTPFYPEPRSGIEQICDCVTSFCSSCFKTLLKREGGSRRRSHRRTRRRTTRRLLRKLKTRHTAGDL